MKSMKVRTTLTCAIAALALAACNKKQAEGGTAASTNQTVTITQATPPPGGNWTDVVNATSAGYMMGNPNAKVKLVEIGSLSCPHCKVFEQEGVPILRDKYVKVEATPQEKLTEIQNLPTNQVFVSIANLLGFQDWAAARGVPQAKTNQCLSDQKMIDREVELTSDVNTQYPDFQGTPSFIINGTLLSDTASWDKLKPQLDAALK
jgi:protein-disulfide isomerase